MVHRVEASVGRRSLEPQGGEGLVEKLVPFARGLLQSKDALEVGAYKSPIGDLR
jgi:hypothetical protein